jgi:hypothetical protein
MGQINGNQVKLYATYGGATVALKDIEKAVSSIKGLDTEDWKVEQRALAKAISSKR